jgi:Ricin-type beta-trefoil lectin domain
VNHPSTDIKEIPMNRSSRRMLIAIAVASLAVAGSTLGWAQAQARTVASNSSYPIQPYGIDLIIKTSTDPNFCVEATTSSANTPIDIAACAARDIQHWTFLQSSDNSIVIADGGGQCLGYEKSVMLGTVLGPCSFKSSEHFLFSNGQIENRAGKQCLTYAKATQNAAVFFTKCAAGQADQVFTLAH